MFGRETIIIRDGSKLSYDYVPKKLVGRDRQMSMLSMIFRSVVDDGRSETAYVTGSVGTGKTSVVKRFCLDMSEYCARNNIPMGFVHVNCRQSSTDSMVLIQCLRYFDAQYPDKGMKPDMMVHDLRAHIQRSKKRFVIVLDEVNSLIRSGDENLIYQLSRIGEEGNMHNISLSLILISQEYVLDRLDMASLSSFKRANTIRFERYARNELRDIVSARAEEAMVPGTIGDEAIDAVADMVAGEGDARMAIDVLDKAARIAETRPQSTVTAEDVKSVGDLVYSVVNQSVLEGLGKNEALAYLAVARVLKRKGDATLAEAESAYAVVCEEYETPVRKHTQFTDYINTLINSGLIVADGSGPRRTKILKVPDIPAKELCKKLEDMLNKVVR